MTKNPYKQGLLDGMCGFYSVINAIYYLKSDMSTAKCEKLLKSLILTKPYSFHSLFCDGTYYENVKFLINHVCTSVRGYKDISYSTPFENDVFENAEEYTSCLKEHVDGKNSVAIISVGQPWNHWTVLTKVDSENDKIHIFDSYFDLLDKGSMLNIKDLTIKRNSKKYYLYTEETIVITKKT